MTNSTSYSKLITLDNLSRYYDNHHVYVRDDNKYMIYLKDEHDMTAVQFAVTLFDVDNLADYAWAYSCDSDTIVIVKHETVTSAIPTPEWDEDCYDYLHDYLYELIEIACAALEAANK